MLVEPVQNDTFHGGNNCNSPHGEFIDGTCVCEIRFEGAECQVANASYFAGLASVFLTLALVCLVQLVMCVLAERSRMKAPSILRACRVTTQKLLYLVVFLASVLRGAYFTSPDMFARGQGWSSSLMSAYYPLLLSGSSLVVCFWAEVFHLRDIRWEKSQFLSKSFVGFIVFNLIAYSLLVAEFYTLHYLDTPPQFKNFYIHVFNGCYAVLLFIVVTFFLIYGVQVFVKVRGGFLVEIKQYDKFSTNKKLFRSQENLIPDVSQLQQSRIGLLSQTLMLGSVVFFLSSETLSELWKYKVPLHSRNWHDLMFRLVEIGVALWFPCVLWNCMSPEQLWILNPKRIIKGSEQQEEVPQTFEMVPLARAGDEEEGGTRCFVCQEPCEQRVCNCNFAHDPCICQVGEEAESDKMTCNQRGEIVLACMTCRMRHPLIVHAGKLDWAGLFASRPFLLRLALLVGALAACAYTFVLVSPSPPVGTVTIGLCFFLVYIGVRNLWGFTDSTWQKAKQDSREVRLDMPELVKLNGTIGLQRGGPTDGESRPEGGSREMSQAEVTVQLLPQVHRLLSTDADGG